MIQCEIPRSGFGLCEAVHDTQPSYQLVLCLSGKHCANTVCKKMKAIIEKRNFFMEMSLFVLHVQKSKGLSASIEIKEIDQIRENHIDVAVRQAIPF